MNFNNDFKEQEYKEPQDEEISFLFDKAIDEIDKINQPADEKKKEIVIRLAQDLEGKTQKDRICIEIVKRVKDKVSDTLIRDCLPEKYKQKYRIINAKKQKKRKNQKETNLAPVMVLNQPKYPEEEEKQKDKVAVMIGVDGGAYVKRDDGADQSSTSDILKGNSFSQPSYQTKKEQEQHPKNKVNLKLMRIKKRAKKVDLSLNNH